MTRTNTLSVQRLRSLLFLPTLKQHYFPKALLSSASGFILDLEDSIGPARKEEARLALPRAFEALGDDPRPVLVRVNAGERRDLDTVADLPVAGLILPKVESEKDIDAAESRFRHRSDAPMFFVSIETPAGLYRAEPIAAHPSTAALMFGAGDFILSSGIAPRDDLLVSPALAVNFAARAHGKRALGLAGTIGEYRDPGRLRELVVKAREVGFTGSPAIHPDQIAVLNEGFAASLAELERARAVVNAYEQCDGSAFQFNGEIIERGSYERAKALLAENA